jgi:GNAT superfamily N-acetyltransferase
MRAYNIESAMLVTRTACSDDAEAAVAVLRASITKLCELDHRGDTATLATWLSNKTPENFLRWQADPDNCLLVAEQAGSIRGVGCLHRSGEIRLCYVQPGFQRSGVGRALLQDLEGRARLWRLTRLTLNSTAGARVFYERQGFRATQCDACAFGVLRCYPYERALT